MQIFRMNLNRSLFIFATILICTWASTFFDQEWSMWKTKYNKNYSSTSEELLRRKMWEKTWHKVQEHNKRADQGLSTYWMAMNHFADITPQEIKKKNCLMPNGNKIEAPVHSYGLREGLPEHVDWRDSKCVTEPKNQGLCGSCWAFSTVGVVESRMCIQNQKLIKLSEQQLVDCDGAEEACCGGIPAYALKYVTHHGVMRAEDYEYQEKQNPCAFNEDKAIKLNLTKYYQLPDEDSVVSSVALEGPVSVSFGTTEDFMHYSHGIYDGDCTESANHAIIAVGYGTEKNDDGEEQPYWIIKNSWSEGWGEKGFGRIQRGIDQCSFSQYAASFDFLE
ncbi:cathepsin L-like proteinase isoform X2 [Engystomops pustulosus]|uniref:cathepsin L-like proteinase isoform X2 n=1 Tax=Engystomops pustulosus TaxID=76066 RepID=UPI003AFAEDE3